MVTKTLFMGLAVLALFSAPALAKDKDTDTDAKATTTSGSTSSKPRLSSSDEDFLSEMPMDDFPGAAELADPDGDGVTTSIPSPFDDEEEEEDKPKVKYVYKPTSSTSLRRSVVDTRLGDDGYVQGLMQRGPE